MGNLIGIEGIIELLEKYPVCNRGIGPDPQLEGLYLGNSMDSLTIVTGRVCGCRYW